MIEHVGNYASRGHYISYNLDADDNWVLHDDHKIKLRDIDSVLEA